MTSGSGGHCSTLVSHGNVPEQTLRDSNRIYCPICLERYTRKTRAPIRSRFNIVNVQTKMSIKRLSNIVNRKAIKLSLTPLVTLLNTKLMDEFINKFQQ